MAVCRYTQKENTPPKLVLLVPQAFAEQEDEVFQQIALTKFLLMMRLLFKKWGGILG